MLGTLPEDRAMVGATQWVEGFEFNLGFLGFRV